MKSMKREDSEQGAQKEEKELESQIDRNVQHTFSEWIYYSS